MKRKKRTIAPGLSARQKALIDALAVGAMDLSAALEKYGVSRKLYRRWLAQAAFADELAFRRDCAQQQCRMILTRFAPAAAARLVALTESDKEETVRRVCLDILTISGRLDVAAGPDENDDSQSADNASQAAGPQISPVAAAKILDLLARDSDYEQKAQANPQS